MQWCCRRAAVRRASAALRALRSWRAESLNQRRVEVVRKALRDARRAAASGKPAMP